MGAVQGRPTAGTRRGAVVAMALAALGAGSLAPSVSPPPPDLTQVLRHAPSDVVEAYVDRSADRRILTPAPGTGPALRARYAADARVAVTAEREPARRASSVPTGAARWAGAGAVGGAPMTGEGKACTLGFTGTRGGVPVFLTAGHCGGPGTAFASGGAVIGVIATRVFPEKDYALGVLTGGYGSGLVRSSGGDAIPVRGSSAAGVGEQVCTLGATSGWSCGTVLALDVTVRYGSGPQSQYVRGLTKVGLCTAGGDSGGPWLWGTQAQGLTSGGANGPTAAGGTRCGAGEGSSGQAVAYFQPLAPILAETGVVLDTDPR